MRRALHVVLVLASALLLLAAFAGVPWGGPLAPTFHRDFPGATFVTRFGSATPRGDGLDVTAAGEDHLAMQTVSGVDFEASRFPLLRYRLDGFPATLELALVFRTAANPDDVQTVSLPWPGRGATFDLTRIRAWRGTITELGFAEYATPQVVPPALGFRPFELAGATLETPSWRGQLAALVTDWFGDWPWSQRSVHALGRDTDTPRAASIVPYVALVALAIVLWGVVVLRWRDTRLGFGMLAAVALGWALLDARWQAGLVWRLGTTRELYAGLDWPERERRVADADTEAAARHVKAILAGLPESTRVLVKAASEFETLRLIWFLAPRDTGMFDLAATAGLPIPPGTVIVFYDIDWHDDPQLRAVRDGSQIMHRAGVVFDGSFDPPPLTVLYTRGRHGR